MEISEDTVNTWNDLLHLVLSVDPEIMKAPCQRYCQAVANAANVVTTFCVNHQISIVAVPNVTPDGTMEMYPSIPVLTLFFSSDQKAVFSQEAAKYKLRHRQIGLIWLKLQWEIPMVAQLQRIGWNGMAIGSAVCQHFLETCASADRRDATHVDAHVTTPSAEISKTFLFQLNKRIVTGGYRHAVCGPTRYSLQEVQVCRRV